MRVTMSAIPLEREKELHLEAEGFVRLGAPQKPTDNRITLTIVDGNHTGHTLAFTEYTYGNRQYWVCPNNET